MAGTATRTSKPAAVARPARRSTRASASTITHVTVPKLGMVKAPPEPAIKLGNAKAVKDSRFTKVMEKLDKSSAKTKEHPASKQKAAEAQAASQPPANEKLAGAQAQQVDTMQDAETKKPDSDSFLTLLKKEIEKAMPKNLGETENFMKGDDKNQLKGAVSGNVNKQKDDATGSIKAASNETPDPSKIEGKEVQPLPAEGAPATPPAVGAADAMPAPKTNDEVSLQKGKDEANNNLTSANITPQQLQKANDPRFSAVLTAKSSVDKQADAAPQKYRTEEQKTLNQAATKAVGDEKRGLLALQGTKGKTGNDVKARQLEAKAKDEQARKKVTNDIQAIFNKTKEAVDAKLSGLEQEVSTIFDKGLETALNAMTTYIDDTMYKWKLKRYILNPFGAALWLKDKLLDLPDETKAFFTDGRQRFTDSLNGTIEQIAKLVETRLKEAKDLIAGGQKEISDYVKQQPKELQGVAQAAEKEMNSRFDELQQSVDNKKNELAQNLAQRYKEANEKADTVLKEKQEENKGLLTVLKEKVGEVVKILTEFKERIMGMLKQGKAALDLIVADPIGFLKNLLNAVKLGLNQFVNNIWTHLKAGFMKWLLGSLADAGIELPKDFSLGSILKLVLSILGLTYPRIRAKAVKLVGETTVKVLETVGDLLVTFVTGGAAALWEKIKEYLSNLKEMVLDEIQSWVVTTVIKAAVTKLATMFNPVGAIVQAIITIYNTVMFFIERINQILDFVQAIITSVYKIAIGDIASAANWVEQALANTIPIIIGFLARLLGLSGITDTIKGIIQKIQSKVDAAVDKVIAKIVGGIGKLIGKGKAAVSKIVGWWKAKKQFTTKNGEKHTLSFSGEGKNAVLMIASKPTSFVKFVTNIKATGKALAIAKDIDSLKVKEAGAETQGEEIINHLNALADEIILFALDSPKNPPSVIKYGPLTADGGGTLMDATILSENTTKGTTPQDEPLIWNKAKRREGDVVVQGHLLNMLLGGPGRAYNLTPITKTANGAHLRSTEKFIKDIILIEGGAVRYRVEVIYKDKGSQKTAPNAGKTKAQKLLEAREYEQRYLARGLQITWAKLIYEDGKWVDDPKGRSNSLSVLSKAPDDDNIDVKRNIP